MCTNTAQRLAPIFISRKRRTASSRAYGTVSRLTLLLGRVTRRPSPPQLVHPRHSFPYQPTISITKPRDSETAPTTSLRSRS
jgi:hypothetical protein